MIIGVIKGPAVRLHGKGGQHAVEKEAFHVVAVFGVAREAEKVAVNVDVGVAATGGFEIIVVGLAGGLRMKGVEIERCGQIALAGSDEPFVGTPARRRRASGLW